MKRKTAKEILAESFIELAQTKKIDKITVNLNYSRIFDIASASSLY